ncbi:MAG: hypothetical protein ACREB7_15205 [Sphingopyxis sp.]|uniref:hypothetical protein n=1 Tax=Sphingopyxis sp. TaxID=1908224 RepID=UPI003D6CD98E
MVQGKAILTALLLAAGATAASATDVNSAAVIGANAMAEHVRAFPAGRDYDRAQVLKQLNRVCASDTAFDRKRCARAWRIINDAHAELQAKRAAEAAAAATPD